MLTVFFSETSCLYTFKKISLPLFLLFFMLSVSPTCLHSKPHNSQKTTKEQTPIKRNRLQTIIVDNYYPYTFVNEAGQPDGFSVDLIKAVIKSMDLELDIQVDEWDKAQENLKIGKIDLLPMMAYSKVRDQYFDFSVPHTIAFDAFFTRKNTKKIESVNDLHNKTIIVMKQDQAHDYLKSIDFISPDQLILVESIPKALKLLSSGKGYAALIPKVVGLVSLKKMNLTNLEMSPIFIHDYNRPFSFAVKKENQMLLGQLTQGLLMVKETGRYRTIFKKWFRTYDPAEISPVQILKYFIWWVAGFILLCGVLLLWSLSLKKQVALRTKHLKKAHDELDHRVQKRTFELTETNKQLCIEINERKQAEKDREKLIKELRKALENIKTLSGLVPICAKCKKIRDDKGYWNILEQYIETHSDVLFSHGMCPECLDELYGTKDWYIKSKKKKN